MSLIYDKLTAMSQPFPNPMAYEQALQLARMCALHQGTRLLDLACGRGEMLNLWAREYNIQGTGIDPDAQAIHTAMTRANELEVWSQVQFAVDDALDYPQDYHQYNIVSYLSAGVASQIEGKLGVMRVALRDNEAGLLLFADCFWRRTPTRAECDALGVQASDFHDLADLVSALESCGTRLQDMLILNEAHWDSYYAREWRAVNAWLKDNPTHPDAPAVLARARHARTRYLKHERDLIGWGVFVLEAQGTTRPTPYDDKPLWED
jgi:SAM-dependent methyltransferase